MRLLIIPFVAIILSFLTFVSCKSGSGSPSFCDTACLKDSIKFSKDDHPFQPYVYISANNCVADTITWSFIDMGINRKMAFSDLAGTSVKLNKDYIDCFIKDTSYAWLRFNDCSNGRGFLIKIPFDKKTNISRKASGLNKFDPKFSIAEGLIAYSDSGNIFVEDMATGKAEMMTFGDQSRY